MDDLISRQAAIDVINKIFPVDPMRNDYTQGITCGAALATEFIIQLPSIDAVEVVRCRDCEYRDHDRCEIWEYHKVPDMGFCHEGVKK